YWLATGGGLAVFGKIARYNLERRDRAGRWRPILERTDVPIRVVWGDRDPIAVLEIGRRLAAMSGGPLRILEGVGHYPQMEARDAWPAKWRYVYAEYAAASSMPGTHQKSPARSPCGEAAALAIVSA